MISCVHINVDVGSLASDILVPDLQILLLSRHFIHEDKYRVFLYDDTMGNEMFLVERAGRVMGRYLTEVGDVFFIEPCNNWERCHVWKHYYAQEIFVQEVEEIDTDMEILDLDNDERRRIEFLRDLGRQNQNDVVEFSLKFYYTNQFMESTDDIELFAESIIIDMNMGYENSNIALKVKNHCIEHADIDDQESSSDTLHVFNKYKPSYADIRGSADAAQLLANEFENCGSGYTYTVTSGHGHTLTTAKKSCSASYHSSLHEVGHNFGCHHDRDNGDNSHYEYGYGWLIGPEDLDSVGYRTVLAYSNPGYSRRVLQLSNPDIEYNGYPTGVEDRADNARVIRDNRFLMADIGDESQSC